MYVFQILWDYRFMFEINNLFIQKFWSEEWLFTLLFVPSLSLAHMHTHTHSYLKTSWGWRKNSSFFHMLCEYNIYLMSFCERSFPFILPFVNQNKTLMLFKCNYHTNHQQQEDLKLKSCLTSGVLLFCFIIACHSVPLFQGSASLNCVLSDFVRI